MEKRALLLEKSYVAVGLIFLHLKVSMTAGQTGKAFGFIYIGREGGTQCFHGLLQKKPPKSVCQRGFHDSRIRYFFISFPFLFLCKKKKLYIYISISLRGSQITLPVTRNSQGPFVRMRSQIVHQPIIEDDNGGDGVLSG